MNDTVEVNNYENGTDAEGDDADSLMEASHLNHNSPSSITNSPLGCKAVVNCADKEEDSGNNGASCDQEKNGESDGDEIDDKLLVDESNETAQDADSEGDHETENGIGHYNHADDDDSENENEGGNSSNGGGEESMAGFLKLLPYLYLMQRNYGSTSTAANTSSSLIPNFELTNFQLCNNNSATSQSQSGSDRESFKNMLNSTDAMRHLQALRYLQQFLPSENGSRNGEEGGYCYMGASELHSNNSNKQESEDEDMNVMDDSSDHEEPLDLTHKNDIDISRGKDEKLLIRTNQRSERGYTVQDLEAALHDIQSGKLGTRRAAVIYGIPRSTLRNKMYKLGKSPSAFKAIPSVYINKYEPGKGSVSTPLSSPNEDDPEAGGIREEGTFAYTHRHLPRVHGASLQAANKEGYHHPLLNKRIIDTSKNPASLFGFDPFAVNLERVVEESLNDGERSHHGHNNSHQVVFRSESVGGGRPYNPRGQNGSTPSLSLSTYARPQSQPLHCSGRTTRYLNYNESSLGKKSRPKRGKYRNYDREALAKAVLAVQNGEMSVHRAGSYFGVPHSTLEYKVKERHLLRQAKFKGKTPANNNKQSVLTPGKMAEHPTTLHSPSLRSLSPPPTMAALSSVVDIKSSEHKPRPTPSSDLERSLAEYLKMRQRSLAAVGESRWGSAAHLFGLGLDVKKESDNNVDTDGDADSDPGLKKGINDPLPKIYDSNETSSEAHPSNLLDLTRRT